MITRWFKIPHLQISLQLRQKMISNRAENGASITEAKNPSEGYTVQRFFRRFLSYTFEQEFHQI